MVRCRAVRWKRDTGRRGSLETKRQEIRQKIKKRGGEKELLELESKGGMFRK